MKIQRSLLRRLVISQLIVVIAFSLLAVVNVLWHILRKGEGEYDRHLTGATLSIMAVLEAKKETPELMLRDITIMDEVMRASIAYEKTGKSPAETNFDAVIRLVDQSGNEIYRSPGRANVPITNSPLGSSEFTVGSQRWRGATVQSKDKSLTLQFAQANDAVDNEIVDIIFRFILWPMIFFLPIAGLVSWFSSWRGLSPLRELTAMIARRSPRDMKPLESITSYCETTPLVDEINTLLGQLNTTLARERNFLADAAHELRTPLAVIQAQVHVLRHATTEADKSSATEELNVGIGRAASLIQKLLLTARVSGEDFAPRFEVVDLTVFVQERIATLSALATSKRIEMELKAPPRCFITIDRETFISAVDNVIDNAIRYTPAGGTIMIEIDSLMNAQVRLRIADNGAGIPPELHERVFERFYRVGGSEQTGSGLGLAIVKRVLTLHGGEVRLSTGLDQRGLAVDLTMPVGV
jgi:two-component system, OmpR family, sensor histidine kinase QseC